MVNLGDGKFSPCCGYHSMSNAGCDFNLQTWEKQLKPFSSDSGGLWKEKFHIYSEQVPPNSMILTRFCLLVSAFMSRKKVEDGNSWYRFFLPIQSKPLEEYYRKQKKLLDFHVAGAPGETWQGLLTALHLQHMNAVSSSRKLTAWFVFVRSFACPIIFILAY